jgi:hypothetical protein
VINNEGVIVLRKVVLLRRRRRLSVNDPRRIVFTLVLLSVSAGSAAAAAAAAASISANWAGYGVLGLRSHDHFQRVIGTWTQPAATCSVGHQTYSAFWVGLGGLRQNSTALEQTGTEADCTRSGHPSYGAWYELLPAGAVRIKLDVRPGDTIAASVTVGRGRGVVLHLRDETTHREFSRRVLMRAPDTSSAEWIAEAPSTCERSGCTTLPLTNFGSVSFTAASVQTDDGRSGSISDPAWSAVPIELQGDLEAFAANSAPVSDGAKPSELMDSGSAFTVTWQQMTVPTPATPPALGPPPGL